MPSSFISESIRAGQLDIFDACMMSISSSRCHLHVNTWMACCTRSVSGQCFEIETFTIGQHSVAEKDSVVSCLHAGFQKARPAEAVLGLINHVSFRAGEWNCTGLFLCGGILYWFMGLWVWLFAMPELAYCPLLEVCKRSLRPDGGRWLRLQPAVSRT